MADLRTRYLGLELRTPLVASSSPLTGTLDGLKRLEATGAGAVVLPSLFEEDLAQEAREVEALLATGATGAEARAGHPQQAGYGAGAAAYLALVEQAKANMSIPVIASLNGTSRGGWVRHAARLDGRPDPRPTEPAFGPRPGHFRAGQLPQDAGLPRGTPEGRPALTRPTVPSQCGPLDPTGHRANRHHAAVSRPRSTKEAA